MENSLNPNKHTFVICAYKESEFLEPCIQSLLDQTLKTQILMITSTDNEYIRNMAKKYTIPLSINAKGGIGEDWNFALDIAEEAGYEYVTLAHQDDIYLPSYAKKCLGAMTKDSLIAFTNYQEIKNGEVIPKNKNLIIKEKLLSPIKAFPKSKFIRNRSLSLGNGICCPAVTYHLNNLGAFRFATNFTSNLDWDAWYRIGSMDGSFCYLPEALMCHRIHENSETSNAIENDLRTQEDLKMLKRYWPAFLAKLLNKFYSKGQESNG